MADSSDSGRGQAKAAMMYRGIESSSRARKIRIRSLAMPISIMPLIEKSSSM